MVSRQTRMPVCPPSNSPQRKTPPATERKKETKTCRTMHRCEWQTYPLVGGMGTRRARAHNERLLSRWVRAFVYMRCLGEAECASAPFRVLRMIACIRLPMTSESDGHDHRSRLVCDPSGITYALSYHTYLHSPTTCPVPHLLRSPDFDARVSQTQSKGAQIGPSRCWLRQRAIRRRSRSSQLQEHDQDVDGRVEQVCMLGAIIYSMTLLSAHAMISVRFPTHGLDHSSVLL